MNITTWEEFKQGNFLNNDPIALSIGVFDGLHKGHQALLKSIVNYSTEFSPTVLTFRENPAKTFGKDTFKGNITSLRQKLSGFSELGIKNVVLIDFSTEFSKLTGKEFILTVQKHMNLKYLAVGHNFRCGYKAMTNAEMIKEFCTDNNGCTVQIFKPVTIEGVPVSSTKIRELIRSGEIRKANTFLYKPYSLEISDLPLVKNEDEVSINTASIDQVLPHNGVYAAIIYNNSAVSINITVDNDAVSWREPKSFTTKEILFKSETTEKE